MKKILLCSVFLFFATALFAQQTEKKPVLVKTGVFEFNYGFVGDNASTYGLNIGGALPLTESLYSSLTVGWNTIQASAYGYNMELNSIPIQLGLGFVVGSEKVYIDPHVIASLNCVLKGGGTGLGIKLGAGLNFYGIGLVGRYNLGGDNSDGYFEIALRIGIWL